MQRSEDEAILFKRALAHAGFRNDAVFRLQREPFGANQRRADADWKLPATSGDPSRPWLAGRPHVHAEIIFNEAQQGPLLIGDGRFLGLGLFRAEPDETTGRREAARYRLTGSPRLRIEDTILVADILRKALMSGGLPPLEFSGHSDRGPLRADSGHAHAFFLPEDADSDGFIDHLTVYCRRGFSDSAAERLWRLQRLWWNYEERGRRGSRDVGVALLAIGAPETIPGLERLIGPSRHWFSATPYFRPRYSKPRDVDKDRTDLVRDQIHREWPLRFPESPIPVIELSSAPTRTDGRPMKFKNIRVDRDCIAPDQRGSFVRLEFQSPVIGPILLGRAAHFGLGQFVATPPPIQES